MFNLPFKFWPWSREQIPSALPWTLLDPDGCVQEWTDTRWMFLAWTTKHKSISHGEMRCVFSCVHKSRNHQEMSDVKPRCLLDLWGQTCKKPWIFPSFFPWNHGISIRQALATAAWLGASRSLQTRDLALGPERVPLGPSCFGGSKMVWLVIWWSGFTHPKIVFKYPFKNYVNSL